MKTFTFNAVKTYKNNMSKSDVITFEYNDNVDKLSMSLLSVIHDIKRIHDSYLIDNDTKCNITFDVTVELKGNIQKIINKENFIRIVTQPFMRFHYSKSGKAIDYLELEGLVKRSENLFDGGLWFDSSFHYEKIKNNLVRNKFNEFIYQV